MNRRTFLTAAALLATSGAARADDAFMDAYRAWREKRDAALRHPDGWLALAGLFWLAEGDNTLGHGADRTCRFPRGPAAIAVVRLTADGQVTLDAADGVAVTVNGQPVRHVTVDLETEEGTQKFAVDGFTWFVIKRDGRLAIRLKDRESPVLATFHGVTCFAPSAAWRLPATFKKSPPGKVRRVPTAQATFNDEPLAGTLTFEAGGRACHLEAYGNEADNTMMVVFGDLTNGHESYPAGRYLQVDRPDAAGHTVIDFNRAYNPPCAFTSYATCSWVTPENKLPIRVDAGEKRPH